MLHHLCQLYYNDKFLNGKATRDWESEEEEDDVLDDDSSDDKDYNSYLFSLLEEKKNWNFVRKIYIIRFCGVLIVSMKKS